MQYRQRQLGTGIAYRFRGHARCVHGTKQSGLCRQYSPSPARSMLIRLHSNRLPGSPAADQVDQASCASGAGICGHPAADYSPARTATSAPRASRSETWFPVQLWLHAESGGPRPPTPMPCLKLRSASGWLAERIALWLAKLPACHPVQRSDRRERSPRTCCLSANDSRRCRSIT